MDSMAVVVIVVVCVVICTNDFPGNLMSFRLNNRTKKQNNNNDAKKGEAKTRKRNTHIQIQKGRKSAYFVNLLAFVCCLFL